jgi:hypothetical protein
MWGGGLAILFKYLMPLCGTMNDEIGAAIPGEAPCLADRDDDKNAFSYISGIFGRFSEE